MEITEQESPLTGDDLTQTEQSHFDEFAGIENMAAELEGEAFPNSPQQAEYQEPQVTGKELVAPVVALACTMLAPAWNIQKEEVDALSGAYGDLLDKYFPEGAGAFGVELSALLVTGAIIMPRLGTPRKEETKIDNTKEAANDETES
ncbi:hypothetical protein [Shewanella atlantica]|uniref:Uncharacterized protein n=1 Tax=Shewanella atlantica TaxID=271099 RepID=A0A3S0KM20_9GAMM|nr:hypothetical protein [Shewanella atlantica]RTR33518.1 hypothetical protein EKG39_07285 [Shewanella atlantica]